MRILMVHSRELCYFSGGFFLDRIQTELEKNKVTVDRVEVSDVNADFDVLESYLHRKYDAVLDINSRLPYLTIDNGSLFLDALGAPFFNYILDHPLYHHPGLAAPVQNYHALGIDHSHVAYMKRYYPHLRLVHYLPVAGTEAVTPIPFKKREIPLLFSGTALDENDVKQSMEVLGEKTKAQIQMLIQKWDTAQESMEEAVSRIFPETETMSDTEFALFMNRLYPADKWKRDQARKYILEEVAKRKINMTVMGEGWEWTRLKKYDNVRILPPRPIAQSIEVMAGSQCFMDINPLFFSGLHDRVTTALANRCACFSDMSMTAESRLQDGKTIIYYQKEDMDQLCEKLQNLDEKEKEELAENGHTLWKETYSWKKWSEKFLAIVEQTI